MKSKKSTISIALWGFIGWKIYDAFHQDKAEVPITKKELKINQNDSISLLLKYRDPFLGKYAANSNIKDTLPKRKYKPSIVPVYSEPEIPPNIQYKGIMSIGKATAAILQSDNKIVTIRKGETVDGCKLIRIDDDKVLISKGRKKYEIPIQ